MTDETTVPDISVVIPCYNAERWVGRAIDSVLAQEGVTVEVIVIDDGSTDGSVDVLRRYEGRIHRETGPNRGACAARNRGLALAQADYVMFLDADDYLAERCLRYLQQSLLRVNADISIGNAFSKSSKGSLRRMPGPSTKSRTEFICTWLTGQWVPPCAVLWRKEALQMFGAWDETLSKHQDAEIMMRSAALGAKLAYAEYAESVYFEGSGKTRISQKQDARAHRDILRTRKKMLALANGTDIDCQAFRLAIASSLHKLEAKCLIRGQTEIAHEIIQIRKELGVPRFQGSKIHCITCSILGLRRKTKLSNYLHDMKNRLYTSD